MDGKVEYLSPRQVRSNARKKIPGSDPLLAHPDMIKDNNKQTSLTGLGEDQNIRPGGDRDGFYCGDAIMFYPDTNDLNGAFQTSSEQGKITVTMASLTASATDKPHKCMQCGSAFKQRSHLKAHIRTHTGEKPFGCEVCGKTFARLDSAVRHMKIHAAEGEERQMKQQESAQETVQRLTPLVAPPVRSPSKRREASHGHGKQKRSKSRGSKDKHYKCFDCDMSFRQQCHLKVHKRIHTGEKPFVCDICGKTFGRKYSADRHMKTHADDKLGLMHQTFIPPPSTSHSDSIANLLPKLERVQGFDKPFRCDQCTAAFTQRSHLRNHLRTHSGEKPYGCDACGKTFSRKYSAMRHMRTHTGEKQFKCEFCGNCYSQRFHLRDHLRTHTGERPFNCPVCDKAFSRKDLAVRHLRTHSGSAKMFNYPDDPE